jgi:hypothetical protein
MHSVKLTVLLCWKKRGIEGGKMVRHFQTTPVATVATMLLLAGGLCAESKNVCFCN